VAAVKPMTVDSKLVRTRPSGVRVSTVWSSKISPCQVEYDAFNPTRSDFQLGEFERLPVPFDSVIPQGRVGEPAEWGMIALERRCHSLQSWLDCCTCVTDYGKVHENLEVTESVYGFVP